MASRRQSGDPQRGRRSSGSDAIAIRRLGDEGQAPIGYRALSCHVRGCQANSKAKGVQETTVLEKADYGIDAPGVVRNLFVIGAVGVLLGLFGPSRLHLGPLVVRGTSFLWLGGFLIGEAGLMLFYALRGKFSHRDRMLGLHIWRGDEQVLDVGTGRGLLLIGAAKRLHSGHAFGLDIWNKADLSGNSLERTERNLRIEGVTNRCTLVSEGAQQMSFADGMFDVVVSNLCLHNIYDAPNRSRACAEIIRVLRPHGVAIISDYKHTKQYAEEFSRAGLAVERGPPDWFRTFPALSIVIARKT